MKNRTAIGLLVCAAALSACHRNGRDARQVASQGSSKLTLSDVPPRVLATNPWNSTRFTVPVSTAIFALYSGPLDATTLIGPVEAQALTQDPNNPVAPTFTLTGPAGSVCGTVNFAPGTNRALFVPTARDPDTNLCLSTPTTLAPDANYTARILTGVKDTSGNAVAATSWTFRTASPPPTPGTLNVSSGADVSSTIALPFTTPVDPATIATETFTLTDSTPASVPGKVFYDASSNSAVLVPSAALDAGATYTVTAKSGIASPAGVHMSDQTWIFTTAAGADTSAPTAISTTPASGSTGAAVDGTISVLLNQAVDPSTVSATTFTVTDLAGAVTYDSTRNMAIFTPTAPLSRALTYVATLSGVKDAAGNAMAPLTWSFTAASLYSGSISDIWSENDGYLIMSGGNAWSGFRTDQGVKLRWDVSPAGGAWQYQYTMIGNNKGVNKWVESFYVGAPQGFDSSDLLPGWTFLEPVNGAMTQVGVTPTTPAQDWTVGTSLCTTSGCVMPITISGIDWHALVNSTRSESDPGAMFILTFRTNRAPVWGDILANSGTTAGCGQGSCSYPVAIDAGFGWPVDPAVQPTGGNNQGWALVPGPVLPAGDGPFLVSTTPLTDARGVSPTVLISATFNEAIDPATISASNFTVSNTSGRVAYDDATHTATFTPTSPLMPSTHYTVSIGPDVKDTAGDALAARWTWSFTTTGPVAPPSVVSTTPADGEMDVALDVAVTATFSEDMDPSTITPATFNVSNIDGGTVSCDTPCRTATFKPTAQLSPGTTYTPAITTGVKTAKGRSLGSITAWAFTTAGRAFEPNDAPPVIDSKTPAEGATDVALDAVVTVIFHDPVDAQTVSEATFTVDGIAGKVTCDGVTTCTNATFTPNAPLASGQTYRVTITSGVKDPGGNALAGPVTWTFQTVAPPSGTTTTTTPPAARTTAKAKGSGCTSGGLASPISLAALAVAALLRRRRAPGLAR